MEIHGLTLTGGDVQFGGGAILSRENLSVADCVITGNAAGGLFNKGGGIRNLGGSLTVTRSTISGNAARKGGGIANLGPFMLIDSTISGNSATVGGGIAEHRRPQRRPYG